MKFRCTSCGHMLRSDEPAGKRVGCTRCGQAMAVPRIEGPTVEEGPALFTLPPEVGSATAIGEHRPVEPIEAEIVDEPLPALPKSAKMAQDSVLFGLLGLFVCAPLGPVAIILGSISLLKAAETDIAYTRDAYFGIALGVIAVFVWLTVLLHFLP